MKKHRSYVLFISLAIVILFVSLQSWYDNAEADTYNYPVELLEITSSGTSDLASMNLPDISITTMSMKRFVALRDDLDGKYDGIYIGSGAYNPAYPQTFTSANSSQQRAAHNTSSLMNDITQLKANEIITKYIDKGLPVILHSDIWKQTANPTKPAGKQRILRDSFQQYRNSGYTNVWILPDNKPLNGLENRLKETPLLKQRPRLEVTSRPKFSDVFTPGDQISLKFNVNNVPGLSSSSPLTANLYLNVDSVLPMGMDHLVTSVPVTTAKANTISYTLPNGYSGPLYWRLEIVNPLSSNKLKDYDTGAFTFKGEKTVIRVLQVLPDNSNSSLKNENNMKQAYLGNDSYKIEITTMLSGDFNKPAVYENLNGVYDMLIFGFRDEYNRYSQMTPLAATAVQNFINTGQSVMFTHDTVYDVNSPWLTYFQTATGQIAPMTNLGLGNPVSGTKTVPVNDGLLTQYPFLLSDTKAFPTDKMGKIATTHNQYFVLDLEDPSLVSWYNIAEGSRDVNDSWNHYYTYSKGNVTYSGTGHTNTKFPEWEQKLFVNTMYRAFMGSNHAPSITVHSPLDQSKLAAHHQIPISYTVNDLDLQDYKVNTSVAIKYTKNGQQVTETILEPRWINRGATVTFMADNPLPEGGELTIEITATDKHGAPDLKVLRITLEKVSGNLLTERTLSANVVNSKVAKNTEVTIEYKITPKPIPNSLGIKQEELVISDISFREEFPAQLQIASVSLPSLSYTGSLDKGFTLAGTFNRINYRLSGDKKQYIADPITFQVKVVPKKNGVYSLANSKLTFKDIGEKNVKQLDFPPVIFEAVTLIEKLTLEGQTILVGDSGKMIYRIEPEDASNKELQWTTSNPSIVTVNDKGEITGVKAGIATITIKSMDGSKKEASAQVKVITPELSIIGPSKVNVGETVQLEASLVTSGERITEVKWAFSQTAHAEYAKLTGVSDPWQQKLTGIKSGTATVKVVVKTESLLTGIARQYDKEFSIQVVNPVTALEIEGPSSVKIKEVIQLKVKITPGEADPETLTWSFAGSGDSAFASLNPMDKTADLTGKQTGTVTVKVRAENGVEAMKTIDIGPVLTAIRLPAQMELIEGETYSLLTDLKLYPASVELSEIIGDLTWSSTNSSNVSVVPSGNGGGLITALQRGHAVVEVIYGPNPSIRAQVTVKVKAKPNSNRY